MPFDADRLQIRLARNAQAFELGLVMITTGFVLLGFALNLAGYGAGVLQTYYSNCEVWLDRS